MVALRAEAAWSLNGRAVACLALLALTSIAAGQEGSQPPHGAESLLSHDAHSTRRAPPRPACVSMTTDHSSPLLPADPAAPPRPLGYLTLHGAAAPAADPASRRRNPASASDPTGPPAQLSIFLALSRHRAPDPPGSSPGSAPIFFASSGAAGHNVRAWLSRSPPTSCPPDRPIGNASLAANCAAAWDTLRMEVPHAAFSCSREVAEEGQGAEEVHHMVLFLSLQVALADEACAPPSLLATVGPPHDAVAPGCSFVTVTASCRPRSCAASTIPTAFAAPIAEPLPVGSYQPSTANRTAMPKSPPPPPPPAAGLWNGRRPAAGSQEGAVTWSAYIPDEVRPVMGQRLEVTAAAERAPPPGDAAATGGDADATAAGAGGVADPGAAGAAEAVAGVRGGAEAVQHDTGESPLPYDGGDMYGGAAGWEDVHDDDLVDADGYDEAAAEEWELVGEWEYDAADVWEYYTFWEYYNDIVRHRLARAGTVVGRRVKVVGAALRSVRPAAVAGGAALTLLLAVVAGQALGRVLKLMSRAEERRGERRRQQRRLAEQTQTQQEQQDQPRSGGASSQDACEPEGGGAGARLWWAPGPDATALLALPPLPPPPRPLLRLASLPRTRSHRQLLAASHSFSAAASLAAYSTAPCSPVSGRSPAASARTSLSGAAASPLPSPLEWAAFQRAASARTSMSAAAPGGRPAPFQGGRRRRCGSTAAASVTAPGCVAAGLSSGGSLGRSGSCPGSPLRLAAWGSQAAGRSGSRPGVGAPRPLGAGASPLAAASGGGSGLSSIGMRRFYPSLAAPGSGTALSAVAAAKAAGEHGVEKQPAAGSAEDAVMWGQGGVASLPASPIAGVRHHAADPSCSAARGEAAAILAAADGGGGSWQGLGMAMQSCSGAAAAPGAAPAAPGMAPCEGGGGGPLAGRAERRVGRSRFGSAPAAVAVADGFSGAAAGEEMEAAAAAEDRRGRAAE